MKVMDASGSALLGECDLPLPPGKFLVIRAVDHEGRYRRLKLPVRMEGGEPVLIANGIEQALVLPGFRAQEGVLVPDREQGTGGDHDAIRPTESMSLKMPEPPPGTGLLGAQVLSRCLCKLQSLDLAADEAIVLVPGQQVNVSFPLSGLQEGNLFWQPAPGVPAAGERVLERIELGISGPGGGLTVVHLSFLAQDSMVIAQDTPLGVLEVRSRFDLPEGMREKVFQSHLLTLISQCRQGG